MTTIDIERVTTTLPTRDAGQQHFTAIGQPPRADLVDDNGGFLLRYVLTMVAICCLTFIAGLVILSPLEHASAQHKLRDQLRIELATGIAPVQAVDPQTHQLIPDGSPIAILHIPDVDLDEVVSFGSTSGVLMNGVGLRRDSTFPGQTGNSVMMGRSTAYGGPFGAIAQLQIGASLTVITGQGVQHFSVVAIRRAGDPLPRPAPSGSRLTLVTATGSAFIPSGLVRVDADLIGQAEPTALRSVTTADVRPAERALAGDPGSVWYLVFALQALLVAALAGVLAWRRWGHLQAWVVCGPLILLTGLWVSDQITVLLPNLL